jgi:hypothetical protein
VQWFVTRGIRRLTARTRTSLDDQVISLIHRPIFWTVVFLGALLAATVAELPEKGVSIGRSIAFSILIFLWMLFA